MDKTQFISGTALIRHLTFPLPGSWPQKGHFIRLSLPMGKSTTNTRISGYGATDIMTVILDFLGAHNNGLLFLFFSFLFFCVRFLELPKNGLFYHNCGLPQRLDQELGRMASGLPCSAGRQLCVFLSCSLLSGSRPEPTARDLSSIALISASTTLFGHGAQASDGALVLPWCRLGNPGNSRDLEQQGELDSDLVHNK